MNQAALNHSTSIALATLAGASSTFMFDGKPVRIGGSREAPLFVAENLCDALNLGKHRDALTKLDADERGSLEVDTLGGRQFVAAVTEGGMYTLILRCRGATTPGTLPHRFRRWVTGEVLPVLRRTGSYAPEPAPAPAPTVNTAGFLEALKDPTTVLALIAHHAQESLAAKAEAAEAKQALVVVEERAVMAEQVVKAAKPKAEFFDRYVDADGSYGLHNAARAIGAPPQGFVDWLKRAHLFYQGGELMPKAALVKLGVFEVKVRMVDEKARSRTFVTPYGLQHLARAWQRHLLKTGQAPNPTLFDAA